MTDRELLTIVSQAWGAISCVTAGARLEIKSITNPVSCRRAPVPCFLRSFSAFSLRFSPCPFLWFLSPGPVGCSCQRLPEPHWSLYQLFPLPGVTFIALQLSHQSVKPYPAKPGAAEAQERDKFTSESVLLLCSYGLTTTISLRHDVR